MARKKKTDAAAATPPPPASTNAGTAPPSASKKRAGSPSTSALIICRNKHWRYISSFHGPWLQLPPEVLESLAHSNYLSPRPHPVHPAVFYDLVKIRKAVDEATNLAVRATSGLTAAALSNSLHASNGMLGGAAALGIGYGSGAGGNAKLSRERKHRMRELATAKLSQAYHLDEIAASVATMQSASTLEDVAQLVLQRNPSDMDAKYVHFFHEKIPSRMMAQCTPLNPLNDIIAARPNDASPLRTRALTRIFKEDYVNSAKDLSESLVTARCLMAQHRAGKDQLVLAKTMQEQYGRDWRQEVKIAEEDQPNSLETQLLFHRAGVYFTIACQHVHAALDGLKEAEEARAKREAQAAEGGGPVAMTAEEAAAHHLRMEARKQVRQNAKRALRDYIAFLSHFDYTPGLSPEIAQECLNRLGSATNGSDLPKDHNKPLNRLLDSSSASSASSNASSPVSDAVVPHRRPPGSHPHPERASWPKLPPPEIFKASQLFEPTPPASLPPYPHPVPQTPAESAAAAFSDSHEIITYHPLLTDALHSLLLCHALIQTPPKELLRHAHNAARLARVCDGYPIFLAARSPARADWIEVLRRAGNWISMSTSWENLCRPAPLPGHHSKPGSSDDFGKHDDGRAPHETPAQKRERQKHEAILEALADERVVDEESFQRAVHARERRQREDDEDADIESRDHVHQQQQQHRTTSNGNHSNHHFSPPPHHSDPSSPPPPSPSTPNGGPPASTSSPPPPPPPPPPKRWAQDDNREYPITTDRAEAIARWVREAPTTVEGAGAASGASGASAAAKKKKKQKKRARGMGRENGGGDADGDANERSGSGMLGLGLEGSLEEGVRGLGLRGGGGGGGGGSGE